MNRLGLLFLLFLSVLLPAGVAQGMTHALPPEAGDALSEAASAAEAEVSKELDLVVDHLKIRYETVLVQLRLDHVRVSISLGHPAAGDQGWRYLAPSHTQLQEDPLGPKLLLFLRAFDQAIKEDPWQAVDDREEADLTPMRSALTPGGAPGLTSAFLFAAYLSHWLLILAGLLLFLLRGRTA